MTKETEMAGNGFPHLDLHDLKDVWRLGNMAQAWASQPLALGPDDLTRYQELCHRYGLAPAEVLMEFQKMAFLPTGMPASVPGESSKPRPHPRQEVDQAQQSGDLGALVPPGDPWEAPGDDNSRDL
jgi:hypothetical protein